MVDTCFVLILAWHFVHLAGNTIIVEVDIDDPCDNGEFHVFNARDVHKDNCLIDIYRFELPNTNPKDLEKTHYQASVYGPKEVLVRLPKASTMFLETDEFVKPTAADQEEFARMVAREAINTGKKSKYRWVLLRFPCEITNAHFPMNGDNSDGTVIDFTVEGGTMEKTMANGTIKKWSEFRLVWRVALVESEARSTKKLAALSPGEIKLNALLNGMNI